MKAKMFLNSHQPNNCLYTSRDKFGTYKKGIPIRGFLSHMAYCVGPETQRLLQALQALCYFRPTRGDPSG